MKLSIQSFLTYAGALPFILGALAVWGSPTFHVAGRIVLSSYSILILSFVAGTHWGYVVRESRASKQRVILLLSSNCIALLAWISYLLLNQGTMLCLFALLFLALLCIDVWLQRGKFISHDYYMMRRNVTIVVSISLFFAAGAFIYPTF